MLWIDACDRSYGSELWIGAREIGIEMIRARELWIGAVDRYRPRGRVDSERERERALTEKMRKKNGLQRERERELYQINEKENGFRERERESKREL